MAQKEKKEQNFMMKLATFIVDKRNLIFLVPIYICVSDVSTV